MDLILLRHAKRGEINSVKDFFEASLIEEGKIDSIKAGKLLAKKYDSIALSSSIIGRCRETAILMGKGIVEEGKKAYLVFPYENKLTFMSFVKDPFEKRKKKKKSVIEQYDWDYVKMIKGWEENPLEEMLTIEEVCKRDENAIKDIARIYSRVEALIIITHDTILNAFMVNYMKNKIKKRAYQSLGYLEGIKTEMELSNREVEINLNEFSLFSINQKITLSFPFCILFSKILGR